MSYYLKKNWKLIFWPCFLGLMAQSAYVIIQLMMMQSFQAAFELDLYSGLVPVSADIQRISDWLQLQELQKPMRSEN